MKLLASSTPGAQLFLAISICTTLSVLLFTQETFVWGLFVLGYFLYGCLGIVVTFHRYYTHNSFTTNPLLIKIFALLGCFAGTGSPHAWTAIHINHHLHSDKPTDPHSPRYKGLRIFGLNYHEGVNPKTKWRMRDMLVDPYLQVLHRYYFGILFAWGVALYALGGVQLLVSLFLAPAAFTALMSNVVNYFGHVKSFGSYRRYNLNDDSVNNWVWALFSWGEGWHNAHHRFPTRHTYSERWWELDISGIIISLIGRPTKS